MISHLLSSSLVGCSHTEIISALTAPVVSLLLFLAINVYRADLFGEVECKHNLILHLERRWLYFFSLACLGQGTISCWINYLYVHHHGWRQPTAWVNSLIKILYDALLTHVCSVITASATGKILVHGQEPTHPNNYRRSSTPSMSPASVWPDQSTFQVSLEYSAVEYPFDNHNYSDCWWSHRSASNRTPGFQDNCIKTSHFLLGWRSLRWCK